LEFEGQPVGAVVSQLDQALVFEAFVQGFAVGSLAATFADLSEGMIKLDIDIPPQLVRESVLYGLEMRLLTRGRMHALLVAVVLESVAESHHAAGSACSHHDWLPVMAGGNAGRHAGVEVVSDPGATGVVATGPNWRLVPGRYLCVVQMRESGQGSGSEAFGALSVADVQVMANEMVLESKKLTIEEIRYGRVDLKFVIDEHSSAPEDAIGVCIHTLVPVGIVVSSVSVDRVTDFPKASESVA
jgi:hypothetical protein